MAIADNSPKVEVKKTEAEQILEANKDRSNWRWVEVPQEDIFGVEHTGVNINFVQYGPGKHFVNPEIASEIERLLANRMRGDVRVVQPRQDAAMARIMAKSQLGAPTNQNLRGLHDK